MGTALAKRLVMTSVRPRVLSAKLLAHHAKYCELLADALAQKARGEEYRALGTFEKVRAYMSQNEAYLEPYYDFTQGMHRLWWLITERGSTTQVQ